MIRYLKSEKGSGLIGLLIVVVIIAALVYSGSFFWPKDTEDTNGNMNQKNVLDKYQQAQEDINKINHDTADYNNFINGGEADSLEEWDTLKRDKEGFQVDYPHGWYYTVNHQAAGDSDYELIIGFASSSKIWEQEPPYGIELLIMPSELELEDVPGRITGLAMEKNNKKYILITYSEEYKDIMEKMANSFKSI